MCDVSNIHVDNLCFKIAPSNWMSYLQILTVFPATDNLTEAMQQSGEF